MRRAALTIVATVVGLVLLLQFKTQPAGTSSGALANLGNAVAPRPHHSPRQRSTPSSTPTPKHTHATKAAAPPPAPPKKSTITGQAVQTPYGVVQVRIVETGSQLTNVVPVQLPNDSSRSTEIAANAAPILRNEALQTGSAHIDIVSGATYTSDGYAQSLQSALDNA